MPYKDKEKQKEAQKDWVRQKRGKGSTYVLSDGRVQDPSTVPDAVIPERVFISRAPGGICSLLRHEFIKSLKACNRANESRFKKVDLKVIESLRGLLG